jgi:hypothetical protein
MGMKKANGSLEGVVGVSSRDVAGKAVPGLQIAPSEAII